MGPGDLIEIEFTITGSYMVRRGDYETDEGALLGDEAILFVEQETAADLYGPENLLNFAVGDVDMTLSLGD